LKRGKFRAGRGSRLALFLPRIVSNRNRETGMYRKPIGPTAHGVIDHAFATLNTLAPTLFGLSGPAKAICYSFAATQRALNALTDTPVGVRKVVRLRMHGKLETPYVPAILL
jgi:hypothetical protein